MSNLIVVGVDGSPESRRALRWALDEALRSETEVRAVYAWQPSAWLPEYDFRTPYDAEKYAAARLHNEVVRVLGERPVNPIVTERAIEGPTVRVLVDAAREAAMLVVGSHGRGRASDLLLGSVSAACVRHSTTPVVVIPPRRAARVAESA